MQREQTPNGTKADITLFVVIDVILLVDGFIDLLFDFFN